jgi:hypothetical protein
MMICGNDQVVGKLPSTRLVWRTHNPPKQAVTKARVGAPVQKHHEYECVHDKPAR